MMKPSKVIRIDAQVWPSYSAAHVPWRIPPTRCCAASSASLKDSAGPARLEPRVTRLLALVRDVVGQMPDVEAGEKGMPSCPPPAWSLPTSAPRKSGYGPKRARRRRTPPVPPPGTGGFRRR